MQSCVDRLSVLQLFGRFGCERQKPLILGCAGGGKLHNHLTIEQRFSEQRTAQYVALTTVTLRHSHEMRAVHSDVKPHNVLLGVHGEVETSDYACSAHAPSHHRTTMCGTQDYSSPDTPASSAKDTLYSMELDVWNLSVLMHGVLVGDALFEDMPATTEHIVAEGGLLDALCQRKCDLQLFIPCSRSLAMVLQAEVYDSIVTSLRDCVTA